MNIEKLSADNVTDLASMSVEMWPDTGYEEELENAHGIAEADDKTAYLLKADLRYIGFIILFIRRDYVEGTITSPVAYIEAIYIRSDYRNRGLAGKLVEIGEQWGREQGCTEMGSDAEIMNEQSIHFHKKMGFEEANRIVCFRKDLQQVIHKGT